MNDARKVLLSETAEQRFSLGEVDIDLVIPAYARTSNSRLTSTLSQ